MAHKYPQRAPQSVVSGSNHLLWSLRQWPGMPSFQDTSTSTRDTSSTGGLEEATCVDKARCVRATCMRMSHRPLSAHTSWVPDLEIDIDLDGMHQDWHASHASHAGCIAPYPPHKTPQAHARTVRAPVAGGTEMVYGQMVHELPSLVVALLKILLAAGVTASPRHTCIPRHTCCPPSPCPLLLLHLSLCTCLSLSLSLSLSHLSLLLETLLMCAVSSILCAACVCCVKYPVCCSCVCHAYVHICV